MNHHITAKGTINFPFRDWDLINTMGRPLNSSEQPKPTEQLVLKPPPFGVRLK